MTTTKEIDPATQDEADELREKYDTVILPSTGSDSHAHLHIPNDGEPACQSTNAVGPDTNSLETDWKQKDMEKYPKGWKPWCKACLRKYRAAKRIKNNLKQGSEPGQRDTEEPTEQEITQLREENDRIVTANGSSAANRNLHIESDDAEEPEPDCTTALGENSRTNKERAWRYWDLSCYPRGTAKWCLRCVDNWRDDQ